MAENNQEVVSLPSFVEEVDYREIEHLEVVGKGSFGTVYKARWRANYVAVKYIEQESERNAFAVEVRQLSRVAHPNIVALYGACTKRPHVCLVMEYAEGGSLYNVLHCSPKPRYSAAHAMSWALQCAEGVAYLHEMRPKPLIHRDLKPPNLLLIQGGRVLKICDFGTVTDKATLMTNNKGSAAWMAPEVFESSTYTEKCDVFSWGIILWEVLSREQPFKEIELTFSIMWSVHKGHRPPLIEGCPRPIENLMTSCWDPSPINRPSMRHVVETMTQLCSFFTGADEPLEYDQISESDTYDSDIDTIDTNQYNSWRVGTQETIATNSSQVSNIIEAFNRQQLNDSARWASPEEDNSEPRIITSGYEKKKGQIAVDRRNGVLPTGAPMKPISVQVDPNAWELNPHDEEEFQKLIGNVANSQGRERLSVTETTKTTTSVGGGGGGGGGVVAAAGSSETTTTTTTENSVNSGDSESSLDLDSMHLMLEPHLRPATPDPQSRLSQQIFQEHKQLAQEYLKVQTEIAYVTRHKEELLAAMDPQQRKERIDICSKLKEKEALLKLESNLKRQLELIRTAPKNPQGTTSTATNQQHLIHNRLQNISNIGSGGIVISPSTSQSRTMVTTTRQSNDGWVIIPSTPK